MNQYQRKATMYLGKQDALQELLNLRFAVSSLAQTCGTPGSHDREMAENAHRGIRERIEYLHDSFLKLLAASTPTTATTDKDSQP